MHISCPTRYKFIILTKSIFIPCAVDRCLLHFVHPSAERLALFWVDEEDIGLDIS